MPEIQIIWSDSVTDRVPFIQQTDSCIVFVDTLRATCSIISALAFGANKVYLTNDLKVPFLIKEKEKNTLLVGERHGKKIDGFDINNSPVLLEKMSRGKTIVINSGNTTRVLKKIFSINSNLYTGTLCNALCLAKFLLRQDYKRIFIVPVGTFYFGGNELRKPAHTEEDFYGALAIVNEVESLTGVVYSTIEYDRALFREKQKLERKLYELEYTKYLLEIDIKNANEENLKDIRFCFSHNSVELVPQALKKDTYFEFIKL